MRHCPGGKFAPSRKAARGPVTAWSGGRWRRVMQRRMTAPGPVGKPRISPRKDAAFSYAPARQGPAPGGMPYPRFLRNLRLPARTAPDRKVMSKSPLWRVSNAAIAASRTSRERCTRTKS